MRKASVFLAGITLIGILTVSQNAFAFGHKRHSNHNEWMWLFLLANNGGNGGSGDTGGGDNGGGGGGNGGNNTPTGGSEQPPGGGGLLPVAGEQPPSGNEQPPSDGGAGAPEPATLFLLAASGSAVGLNFLRRSKKNSTQQN